MEYETKPPDAIISVICVQSICILDIRIRSDQKYDREEFRLFIYWLREQQLLRSLLTCFLDLFILKYIKVKITNLYLILIKA